MNSAANNKKILNKLISNYKRLEANIVNQLLLSSQHPLTTGSYREEVWMEMFAQIIPQKFSIEQSVFIIDASGKVSNEVDLAIFDEQYTPYIFRYGRMKFIPIEAVAVVVQCKSKLSSSSENDLVDWVGSIDQLHTTLGSVTRQFASVSCLGLEEENIPIPEKAKTAQTSTRPLKILCHISENSPVKYEENFDLIIHPVGEKLKLRYGSDQNLHWWYEQLNHAKDEERYGKYRKADVDNDKLQTIRLEHYRVRSDKDPGSEVSLLSLTFKLNQLLMLINNPIMFPHQAYVKMFKDEL